MPSIRCKLKKTQKPCLMLRQFKTILHVYDKMYTRRGIQPSVNQTKSNQLSLHINEFAVLQHNSYKMWCTIWSAITQKTCQLFFYYKRIYKNFILNISEKSNTLQHLVLCSILDYMVFTLKLRHNLISTNESTDR